ncbi:MAG TPA: acylphosphatase [Candidatus Acidoferrales bacterium]
MTETRNARRYFISGGVQGVGFRFFAERLAEKLALSGYVRNLRDGRVEVYAVGSAEQLRALRNELERGPRFASVSAVAEEPAELMPEHLSGFTVEYDA